VAIAEPVQGITIDGDLTDWASVKRSYPVALPQSGDAPTGEADLGAHFRAAYSVEEEALYLAVEVVDESTVIEGDRVDGCEVFLDMLHAEGDSPALAFAMRGERREARGPRGQLLPWEGVQVRTQIGAGRHLYEWRIEPRALGERWEGIQANVTVGLDVVVTDQDGDGSYSWVAWGKGRRKRKIAVRRGDLVLATRGVRTGMLHGRLQCDGDGHTWLGRIQALDAAALWVRTAVGDDGSFRVELPEGRYGVEAGISYDRGAREERYTHAVPVVVEAGSAQELSLLLGSGQSLSPGVAETEATEVGSGSRGQSWHVLGVPDGLPSVRVLDVSQDQDGDLWIATSAGVCRYDGEELVTFTTEHGLAHDEVQVLANDAAGALWLGTRGGISRYDGKRFASFTEADGLASTDVRSILLARDGSLLVGTARGVSQLNRRVYTQITAADGLLAGRVLGLYEDHQGAVWIVTEDGAARYDGSRITTRAELPSLVTAPEAICPDHRGDAWFGTADGVVRFDGESFHRPGRDEGWPGAAVLSLQEDDAGHLWVMTRDAVLRFDGTELRDLAEMSGSDYGKCRSMHRDREGSLWFGTEGGLVRYDGAAFQVFTREDGLPGYRINSLHQDRQGRQWLGTAGAGAVLFDGLGFSILNKDDGLAYNWVYAIHEDDDDNLWFGTTKGASRYRDGRFTTFGLGSLPQASVYNVVEDHQGNVWFHTGRKNATRYDGTRFTRFDDESGRSDVEVTCMYRDSDGHVWLGTDSHGVFRYNGAQFMPFAPVAGLASRQVEEMYQDTKGSLWFGTDAGVFRYDGAGLQRVGEADAADRWHALALLEDTAGRMWWGTEEGVRTLDGVSAPDMGLAGGAVTAILEDGDGNLWFGTDEGVVRYGPAGITRYTEYDGLGRGRVTSILEDRDGNLWVATDAEGVSRYDGGQFAGFFPDEEFTSVVEDQRGHLWFATTGHGVVRFDGTGFTRFAAGDGLGNDRVLSMFEDSEGRMWFGTDGAGACWYDGASLGHGDLGTEMESASVTAMHQDRSGNLWFGLSEGGVSRYDGSTLLSLGTDDGLVPGEVTAITQDHAGGMWFGTGAGQVSRFDGDGFANVTLGLYTPERGLHSGAVTAMHCDRKGQVWIGTDGSGLGRYDGDSLRTYTSVDALGDERVASILEGDQGEIWIATAGGGVTRYDGETFATFSEAHGLAHDEVVCVSQDGEGHLWFGTNGGGISQYDGLVFQSLLRRDGLTHDSVNDVLQDTRGDIWLATKGGITRYRPSDGSPPIRITDAARRGPVDELRLPSSVSAVEFGFSGISFGTRPEQMAYAYRLEGHDSDWRWTRQRQVAYRDLPRGEYRFEVMAVDRDLNYSAAPAMVSLSIHLPYGQIALVGSLAVAVVGLVLTSGYGLRRRRDQRRAERALMQEMEEELQDARRMQMRLMPTESPSVSGLSIAGRCVSASQVGGDFFQYFERDTGISVSLADVTGHAMEAAIPAVMFDGILNTHMETPRSLEALYGALNRSLCRSLAKHTFVCLSMVDVDAASLTMRLSNCGCPYPLHYRSATGEIEDVQMVAYPLGIRPSTEYAAVDVELQKGDYVVLHSDGFSEAAAADGEQFGFEHTAEVIRRGCSEGLSPDELIDRLTGEVAAFTSDEPQADDMTCVVIEVEA